MPLLDSEQTSKPTYPSDKEVESWLKLFPEPPEGAFEPTPPKPRVDKAKRKRRQLAVDKDGSEQLSDQDVDAWLEVFERPEPPAHPAQSSTRGQHKPPQTSKLLKHKQQSQREEHNDASELSPEEREQWQRLFGEEPGM